MEFVNSLNVFKSFANTQTDQLEIYKTKNNKTNDATKSIGGKAVVQIIPGGTPREIKIVRSVDDKVWFTGRSDIQKGNNNSARKAFLKAVLDQYNGKWENVPQSVRDQLELGDYKVAGKKSMLTALDGGSAIDDIEIDSGKPLTARRIIAVLNAIEAEAQNEIKSKTPQEIAKMVFDLMPLPTDTADASKAKSLKMQNLFSAFLNKCTKNYKQNIDNNKLQLIRNKLIAIPKALINNNGSALSMAEMIEVIVGGENKDDKTSLAYCVDNLSTIVKPTGLGRMYEQITNEIQQPFKEFLGEIKAIFAKKKNEIQKQLVKQFFGDLKKYYEDLDKCDKLAIEGNGKMFSLQNEIQNKYQTFPRKLKAMRKVFGNDFLKWLDHPLGEMAINNFTYLSKKTPLDDALLLDRWRSWDLFINTLENMVQSSIQE